MPRLRRIHQAGRRRLQILRRHPRPRKSRALRPRIQNRAERRRSRQRRNSNEIRGGSEAPRKARTASVNAEGSAENPVLLPGFRSQFSTFNRQPAGAFACVTETSMSTAGSFDAPLEIFGGLATRPGLQALFGPLAGNPTVNYVKTYETVNAALRTLALDSNGVLYKETSPGTLASIASGLQANAYAHSTTLFGREYLAISDGKSGNDLPRQYDDTNFDRVSQSGPGAGPVVVDENVVVSIAASPSGATQPAPVAIAASPAGASENGFLVTITTSAPHGLSAGQSVTISGVGVAGYNGTFPVVTVLSSTQFTYIAGASGLAASGGGTAASATATIQTSAPHGFVTGQLVTIAGVGVTAYNGTFAVTGVPDATHFTVTAATGGLAASGGGTASAAGSIDAGVHQVCVIFQTRQGYLTA